MPINPVTLSLIIYTAQNQKYWKKNCVNKEIHSSSKIFEKSNTWQNGLPTNGLHIFCLSSIWLLKYGLFGIYSSIGIMLCKNN